MNQRRCDIFPLRPVVRLGRALSLRPTPLISLDAPRRHPRAPSVLEIFLLHPKIVNVAENGGCANAVERTVTAAALYEILAGKILSCRILCQELLYYCTAALEL